MTPEVTFSLDTHKNFTKIIIIFYILKDSCMKFRFNNATAYLVCYDADEGTPLNDIHKIILKLNGEDIDDSISSEYPTLLNNYFIQKSIYVIHRYRSYTLNDIKNEFSKIENQNIKILIVPVYGDFLYSDNMKNIKYLY